MPPREWMHSYDIKLCENETLKYYLHSYSLPVPRHWNDDDMTIFDKACFGIIPELGNHKSDERNEEG